MDTKPTSVVLCLVSLSTHGTREYVFQGADDGDTVATLARVLGIYVGFQGEIIHENVKKWNVCRFELPKGQRHRDRPVVQEIFSALDRFLSARSSTLAY